MKRLSTEDLLAQLRPGENVFVSGSAGEPSSLTAAIAESPALGADCHFFCSFVPGVNKQNLAARGGREMTVYFMQPQFADSFAEGHVHFAPMTYSNIVQQLGQAGSVDTVLVQVAPADEHGQCSLGPQGEFLPAILRSKARILAVVNPNVPRLANAPSIHVNDIDSYCESDAPLASYDAGRDNAVSQTIAENIASLIPNGATLQCGLGKVPNQLMAALARHRQLKLHTGMVSDGLMTLLEKDVLDLDSPIITTVALGSPDFYTKLTEIPQLRICGADQSHNAALLAQTNRLHAINSALEIDLTRQVNAALLAGRSLSGPGGLPDFAAAARAQADGLSIIALPAADPSGKHSRIVPQLAAGTPVAVPQYNVDAVVTEYGVAMLRGVDVATRARRMMEIAHPDHREQLAAAFKG